ncbi:phage/plasmid primase, P4 family [Bacillota bacterium LX-D]|nr:phage/plasmid primase, P4 family [Bacillota bacterium LX-D]
MNIYEELFQDYVITKNKKCTEKFKDRTNKATFEQVKDYPEFAGVLKNDIVLVDIDDSEQSEILFRIVNDLNLNCVVIKTGRGKHFYFKNSGIKTNKTKTQTAIGLTVDIKLGLKSSYSVIKTDGQFRDVLRTPEELDMLPRWLFPIKYKAEFLDMEAGDGRNQALFNYELPLQGEGFTVEECRETIRIINKYILKEPLSDSELETILRDDAFQKPVFYQKNKFMHNVFGDYLMREEHIVSINNNLHIYSEGIYVDKIKLIFAAMIKHIPTITKNHRNETLSYLEAVCEDVKLSNINKIPVKNGLYNIDTDELEEFTPGYISKNKIPTAYNPAAESSLIDKFLDDLACGDITIRAVIEEMIGTTLYRSSDFDAFFILVGEGSNGKSTLLDLIIAMLGEENICSVELKDLDKTFKTAELFGKLANIGDDISSNDIKNSSFIKKLASGNKVNVERKGQNPFEMKSYAKMIFSSNTTPVIHDTSHGLNRRLILIPLNNKFEKDVHFKSKILSSENLEYLLKLAINGLKRVLKNNGEFTSSKAIEKAGNDYQKLNNPVLAYLEEVEHEELLNESTEHIFLQFKTWCSINNYEYEFQQQKFTAEVKKITGFKTKKVRTPKSNLRHRKKESYYVFVPADDDKGTG